ncbi:unnamed protein product [Prorocentrum cordatum]|uniref:Glycerophosphocholine acyltransferase 1 n=1 Tax=Prorocentrum cordatum TaxID=2364126 RepID=A0ABN9SUA6_9DINO|nr:unnamed protein product [Polarella glacialis]
MDKRCRGGGGLRGAAVGHLDLLPAVAKGPSRHGRGELKAAAQGGDLKRLDAATEAWEAQGSEFISSLEPLAPRRLEPRPGAAGGAAGRRGRAAGPRGGGAGRDAAARAQGSGPPTPCGTPGAPPPAARSTRGSRRGAPGCCRRPPPSRSGRWSSASAWPVPATSSAWWGRHSRRRAGRSRSWRPGRSSSWRSSRNCAPPSPGKELQSVQATAAMHLPSQVIRTALVAAAAEPGADGLLGEEATRTPMAIELGFFPDNALDVWSVTLKATKSPWGALFRNVVRIFHRAQNQETGKRGVRDALALLADGSDKVSATGPSGSDAARRAAGRWPRSRASAELAAKPGAGPSICAASGGEGRVEADASSIGRRGIQCDGAAELRYEDVRFYLDVSPSADRDAVARLRPPPPQIWEAAATRVIEDVPEDCSGIGLDASPAAKALCTRRRLMWKRGVGLTTADLERGCEVARTAAVAVDQRVYLGRLLRSQVYYAVASSAGLGGAAQAHLFAARSPTAASVAGFWLLYAHCGYPWAAFVLLERGRSPDVVRQLLLTWCGDSETLLFSAALAHWLLATVEDWSSWRHLVRWPVGEDRFSPSEQSRELMCRKMLYAYTAHHLMTVAAFAYALWARELSVLCCMGLAFEAPVFFTNVRELVVALDAEACDATGQPLLAHVGPRCARRWWQLTGVAVAIGRYPAVLAFYWALACWGSEVGGLPLATRLLFICFGSRMPLARYCLQRAALPGTATDGERLWAGAGPAGGA